MGKISLVSAKYIIHATIKVEGIVDRPDVIGSVFGQTEGLLGSDLELRELQSSGRIGRIEVDLKTKTGKTSGSINIPSSMDKTETALIAAALETIQRIGPCNAEVNVMELEDVRTAKRGQVISRAKDLLSNLTHGTLPDSRDIKQEVSNAVRVAGVVEYGKDRLPAGPAIEDSEEIIIVEGRADVLNLLKHDIKNSVAMNGTSVPQTIIALCKSKEVTIFVDGDRGGDLILKELDMVADVDYAARAPDGKEVEEITQKEIHQALRSRVAFKQAIDNIKKGAPTTSRTYKERPRTTTTRRDYRTTTRRDTRAPTRRSDYQRKEYHPTPKIRLTKQQREEFNRLLTDLLGTKGAYLLDSKYTILGKVPAKELSSTIPGLGRTTYAVVLDGSITKEILEVAEKSRVSYIIGTKSYVKEIRTRVKVLTNKDLQ
jgi:DNA primase